MRSFLKDGSNYMFFALQILSLLVFFQLLLVCNNISIYRHIYNYDMNNILKLLLVLRAV